MLTSSASAGSSGGKQRRKPRREHRLAGARRPDHQQIVAARGRHFERALGRLLSLHVLQVERARRLLGDARLGRRQELRALEVIDERQERRRRHDFESVRPGRLAARCGGTDEAARCGRRRHRRRQHAGHRQQRAVERELAHRDIGFRLVLRQHAHRRQKPQRDRQVEMAAFLDEVGRREVDRDVARGQRQAHRGQSRAHAFARFADRLVGQAHDDEGGQAGGDGDLGLDGDRLDALERHCANPRDQISGSPAPPCRQKPIRQASRIRGTR